MFLNVAGCFVKMLVPSAGGLYKYYQNSMGFSVLCHGADVPYLTSRCLFFARHGTSHRTQDATTHARFNLVRPKPPSDMRRSVDGPWWFLLLFFVRRVRQRFRFFYGTDQAVLEALESTVAPENLPPPMGHKPLDFQGWLAERMKAED